MMEILKETNKLCSYIAQFSFRICGQAISKIQEAKYLYEKPELPLVTYLVRDIKYFTLLRSSCQAFKLNIKSKMGLNNAHQHFKQLSVNHLYWLDPGMKYWIIWTFGVISSDFRNLHDFLYIKAY